MHDAWASHELYALAAHSLIWVLPLLIPHVHGFTTCLGLQVGRKRRALKCFFWSYLTLAQADELSEL